MQGKSIKGKSHEEIKAALKQSMADGFKPTLAFVFLSVNQDRNEICKVFRDENISIFGSTTNGEFIDEAFQTGTIAILLLDINPAYFSIQFSALDGTNDRSITAKLATDAQKIFNSPSFFITGSGLQTDVEEMIAGFIDVMGNDINAFGGMAGDDLTFTTQYVFTTNQVSDRAVVTLIFDQDKVLMKGSASHGWKAVGTEKTITKSSGNQLFTIENLPALDVCLKYSGLKSDMPNLAMELSMNFPIQLQRPNGDVLMRPSFQVNKEDRSMVISGKLPEGAKIRFSLPPDFDVIENVIEQNKKFRETEMQEADALIIYNCGGRLLCFGPLISEEIKGMKEVWNVPFAGMFSNAEIGRTTGGNLEMHNLTTCYVVLKEK
jgi:hypothetical protein